MGGDQYPSKFPNNWPLNSNSLLEREGKVLNNLSFENVLVLS